MTPTRRFAFLLVLAGAFLAFPAWLRAHRTPSAAASIAAAGPEQGPGLELLRSLRLAGDTPSLSWSPTSDRVAVNSAFRYFTSGVTEAHRQGQGVYVVDVRGGTPLRLTADAGYHPFWLDASTVGWGHSPYEDGQAGLFLSSLKAPGVAQRVGAMEGVYHTVSDGSGELVYFSGFPEYEGWVRLNPRTGARRVLATLDVYDDTPSLSRRADPPADSWNPPGRGDTWQCAQDVRGKAKVVRDAQGRPSVQTRAGVRTLPDAFVFQGYGGGLGAVRAGSGFDRSEPGASGYVPPCLSPDGQFVAWFATDTDAHTVQLRVARLR